MAKKKQDLSPEELLKQALVQEDEQPYKVPDNWVWTRLRNVSEKISDGSHNPPSDSFEGIPLLSAKNIFNYDVNFDTANRWVTKEQWEIENRRTNIEKNDVLLTIVGSIGRTAVVINPDFALQRSVAVIKPKLSLPKYMSFYLSSPYITSYLDKNSKGTAQKGFYLGALNVLDFPLPPSAEQQRIVDRIESLFEKLDQAKELIQGALDSFENRKAAILHRAFTGELTKKWREENEVGIESWDHVCSDKIFEYVTSGSRGWAQYYSDNGDIFIRMGNLNHNTIELDLEDIQYVMLPSKVEGKRSKVQENDILISITADVGMVGLVRDSTLNAYINQHVALARPIPEVFAEYLAWYLVSDLGLKQLQSKQRGATKIGLGLSDLKSLDIALASLTEQRQIVSIINTFFEKEEQARELYGLIEKIDLIKKAILGRAFRGELGTNNPTEESAIELLKEVLIS